MLPKNRAVLLPHPADPLMFRYWINLYKKVWQKEVSKIYIYIGSPIEDPVLDYMEGLTRDIDIGPYYLEIGRNTKDHGLSLDVLLNHVNEENVMLIEDDGFIFKPGVVSQHFESLESGQFDIVGSARGSCATEIWDKGRDKWNLDYSGVGDHGPNFWPCFFFTHRSLLEQTDRNFCAKHWKQGETVPGINYVVEKPEGIVADTFVNTSLQLRAKIPQHRIKMIPQYHGSPMDIDDHTRKTNLWDGRAPWVHVGSLSSGTHGVLTDEFGRPLARRKVDPPKDNDKLSAYCNSEGERHEWERRVQWWMMFYNSFMESDEKVSNEVRDFIDAYGRAIFRIIKQYGLDIYRIHRRIHIYKELGL